jgi:hypothetical protein
MGSSSHLTVRSGVRRISEEPLAAFSPLQPTALLMAALRTFEPYFSLRRIRFRQGRGHGPAAAAGAFHQQSVHLDHRSGSQIPGPMDRQRSGKADDSCSIRTPCSARPFLGFKVFILLALRDAGGFAQGGCQSPMIRWHVWRVPLVDLDPVASLCASSARSVRTEMPFGATLDRSNFSFVETHRAALSFSYISMAR